MNKDFELITDFIYDDADSFSEGIAAVEVDGKWGYINPSDTFYERRNLSLSEFHDGLCQFIEITGDGTKIGFYDTTGQVVIPAEFDFVSRFSDGFVPF